MNSFEKKFETIESLIPDGGRYQVDSDLLATSRANYAAINGLWAKHAQPGFEVQAYGISVEAHQLELAQAFSEMVEIEADIDRAKAEMVEIGEEEERLFTEICANLEEQPFAAKYPLMVFEVGEFHIGTSCRGYAT